MKVRRILMIFACMILGSLVMEQPDASAQQFVVFKVKTPFQMGNAVPDSAKLNDYYVKIGSLQGI